MELNKIYHMNFLDNTIPDKSVQLIIADPPYYRVKGVFDFIWKTFDDYLKDVEKWAIECKRILADNGSLLWYGDNEKIAYTQIILDRYFKIINNVRWQKTKKGLYGSSGSTQIRSFPPCSETILFYSNEWDISSGNMISDKATIKSKDYIRSEIIKAKGSVKLKDINIILGVASNGGGVASSVLSDKKEENTFITKEHYLKLREWLNNNNKYDYLRTEYEELRTEYEELRRPFNNLGYTDTIFMSNEFENSKNIDHDTPKSRKFTRIMLQSCSRPNDIVCIPFNGSGTEAESSIVEKRRFIAFEIDKQKVLDSRKRCEIQSNQLTLF